MAAIGALAAHCASAQQFVTPGQVTYGQQPVMQVAPDGAVHLDGPMAGYSMPANYGQPAYGQPALISQSQAGVFAGQRPLAGQFGNWLFNSPIPFQYEHRSGFFGEFLFLRPRNAEVTYALPIDGAVAPVLGSEVPVGPASVVDFGYEPAFRAGFSLRVQNDSSLSAQYTYFRSDDSDSAIVEPPVLLRSLVTHPLSMNATTDTLEAGALTGIEYDLVDVDFKALLDGCEPCECDNCGNCTSRFADILNYIVGVRYARMDQDFRSSFDVTGTTTVDTSVDFDGGGIRLGLEGERHSTVTGLYVYGQGITNLMVGEFKADYVQRNTFAGPDPEAITSWSAGRVVPGFDLELGFGWVAPRRRLRFSSGYLVSTWFNVVKTEEFINAAQTHNFDDLSSILTFDGLVARAEWEF
ncbi:MAG: Lpg1974 family pore-forming outer membrane protein [Planctomycetota bacterium]